MRISVQKTPAHWIEVDACPLAGSGKIQKFLLRDNLVNQELREIH
jgi:acyl-CoA synthetase (AMP-forming)/AMP-acid ligase II